MEEKLKIIINCCTSMLTNKGNLFTVAAGIKTACLSIKRCFIRLIILMSYKNNSVLVPLIQEPMQSFFLGLSGGSAAAPDGFYC